MSNDSQLTFEDNPLSARFKSGQVHFTSGEFAEAEHCFNEVLEENPDFAGIVDALKIAKFWHHRAPRLEKCPKGQPRADFLLEEWQNYEAFVTQEDISHAESLRNVRLGVFNEVIRHLTIQFQELNAPDVAILKQIVEACINIEDYNRALEVIEYACHFTQDDGWLVALWAEAEHFGGRTPESQQHARRLFWEVFSGAPDEVKTWRLRTPYICAAYKRALRNDHPKAALNAWVAVYGVLSGALDMSRKLDTDDFQRLIERAGALEEKLQNSKFAHEKIIPRLLSYYFWLYYYYRFQEENEEDAEGIMRKISTLDETVGPEFRELVQNMKHHKESKDDKID